jgi:hypothetical protein
MGRNYTKWKRVAMGEGLKTKKLLARSGTMTSFG